MKLHSKNVSTTTTQLKTNVTRSQISDLINMDFYVHKKHIPNPINNNNIIKIVSFNENYYSVNINYFLHERYLKLCKITKNKELLDILDIIEICKFNRKCFNEMVEDELVQELSKSIDKQILNELHKLK